MYWGFCDTFSTYIRFFDDDVQKEIDRLSRSDSLFLILVSESQQTGRGKSQELLQPLLNVILSGMYQKHGLSQLVYCTTCKREISELS